MPDRYWFDTIDIYLHTFIPTNYVHEHYVIVDPVIMIYMYLYLLLCK